MITDRAVRSRQAGNFHPVRRVWKAEPVSSAHPPKAVPAAGIYPPGQRHKPALFHALYGSAGSGCCCSGAEGTPAIRHTANFPAVTATGSPPGAIIH